MSKRVILGMSGGMDSSMSAIMLQEQGYEVIGLTLQTHTEANASHIVEAQNLAIELGIEHHLIDCRTEFKQEVINYFTSEYTKGRTPNPCVHCNNTIKWKYLLDLADMLDAEAIATGHYVRVTTQGSYHYIQKGIDPAKDQSYFLWNLPQEVLSRARFPLGQLQKSEVRKLARKAGYTAIAEKKESMGVCFLSGTDYRQYLESHLGKDHPSLQPGLVVDKDQRPLGQHEGFPYYTIGQKRGIEGLSNGQCVIAIDPENRALVAGKKEDLYTNEIALKNFHLTPDTTLWKNREVFIRIRGLDSVPGYYGHIDVAEQKLHVRFNNKVWAVTPGQSIVFYQGNLLIGGGIY